MNRTEYKTAARQYINTLTVTGKAPATVRKYMTVLEAYGAKDGDEYAEPISVNSWINQKCEETSANTARHYITVLSAFFTWCIKMRILNHNPVVDKPSSQPIRYTLLTLDEIERIINSVPQSRQGVAPETEYRNHAMVVTLILTGLRNEELRELKVSDLNFDGKTITVRHGKGNKRREIPFPRQAREAVSRYIDMTAGLRRTGEGDILFGSAADENGHGKETPWHKLNGGTVNNIVKTYVKAITGKEVHTHTLRHAACAYWDYKGVPVRTVQEALGHASVATTERIYLYVLSETKAAKAITDALDGE